MIGCPDCLSGAGTFEIFSVDIEEPSFTSLYELTGNEQATTRVGSNVRVLQEDELDAIKIYSTSVEQATGDSLVSQLLVYGDADGAYSFSEGTFSLTTEVLRVPAASGNLQFITSGDDDIFYRIDSGTDNLQTSKLCGLTESYDAGLDGVSQYLERSCQACPESSPFSGGLNS